METNQPLVSVNVLMYNSSKYILETLESIKAQTYQNIELIMSDDKSTDNTVQICKKWIAKNKDRFASYQILVPDHNTGQSGNYNRAFRAATGEWIKEIDGDDLLLPNCLTDLMGFVYANPEAKYVFGKANYFPKKNRNYDTELPFDNSFFSKPANEQLEQLLFKDDFICSACSFYNRQHMLDIDFSCDERIPNIEDRPKWINLLRKNVHFYFLDKEIVSYRLFSGISTQKRPSLLFYKNRALFRRFYEYPALLEKGDDVFKHIAEQEIQIYSELCELDRILNKILSLPPFNIYCKIRNFLKNLFCSISFFNTI